MKANLEKPNNKPRLPLLSTWHTELSTDDVRKWDHETRKVIHNAIAPIIQDDIRERMENPMAALHGIVEKLYADRDVLDHQDNIRKLRFAYEGLCSTLGWQLGQRNLYPKIES